MMKIGNLITCPVCEGNCYTDDGKCDECWGTGLVTEQNNMEDDEIETCTNR